MDKNLKQKLKEFEQKSFRHPKFSRKLAKQAERYIDFTCKVSDKEMDKAESKKLIKKTERSEFGKLLKRAKTVEGLDAFDKMAWNIYAKTQDSNDSTRSLQLQELNICLQALDETADEKAAYLLVSDLFEFIGENSPQSLNPDYLKRTISTATTLLEADGKEIKHFPSQDSEDEWA